MATNPNITHRVWSAPVPMSEGVVRFIIVELYRRPDDHTMVEIQRSQLMYGWLDLGVNPITLREEGLVCWHAKAPQDLHECDAQLVRIHNWLGGATWT